MAVDAQILTRFLRDSVVRQSYVGGLAILLAAMCWTHGERSHVVAWLAGTLCVLAARFLIQAPYKRPGAFSTAAAQKTFVRTLRPVYALQGLLWGASVLLYATELPAYAQWGCWMITMTMASGVLSGFSLVQTLARAYLHCFFIPLAVVLPLLALQRLPAEELYLAVPFIFLPIILWLGLLASSNSVARTQRTQHGLQYDLRQKEQEARSAVALKNRFLATAAHDMRQPVVALSLYVEHLLAYPDTQSTLAPKIAAATKAANGLFESLFDLANLEIGEIRLHPQPVDIQTLLADVRDQFEPLAEARGLDLRLRIVTHGELVYTDAVSLKRLIGNVLVNAIKYSPSGKRILLSASRRGQLLRIAVWDQGYGIPAAEVEKIFEEFYRVDRGIAQEIDGMGLGLSIVTRLAQLLHAEVGVTSVVGRGTRFTVHLPIMRAKAAPQEPAAAQRLVASAAVARAG